jgi:Gpi18-like mannosyltransferase
MTQNKVCLFLRQHRRIVNISFLIIAAVAYALLFLVFRDVHGRDMINVLESWYEYIAAHDFGGIGSIYADDSRQFWIADYPSTYYFLLYIFSRVHIFDAVIMVKLISVVFTLISAVLIYFIVKHFRPKSAFLPSLAAGFSLFLPISFLETAVLGQCDIIFISFILASFLALLKNRSWLAWAMFGVSASFKLMAVFFLPFLVYWTLKNWRKSSVAQRLAPLGSAVAVVAMSIPGLLAGLPFGNVLNIYFDRMTTHVFFSDTIVGVGGSGVVNMWMFFNHSSMKYWAIALAGLLTIAVFVFVWKYVRTNKAAPPQHGIDEKLLLLATASILPFTLPFMLDRYFFLPALLSYLLCFKRPDGPTIFVAVILNFVVFWTNDIYIWIVQAGYHTSPLVPPPLILVILAGGVIIYMFYLIYKSSIIYKANHEKTTKESDRKYPWLLTWGRWLVFVLIFSLFLVKSLGWIDPDFGWHLREGQDFLNGVWPATDIYNFNSADYSWAAHEWLSDILMAGLFNVGGFALVAVVWGLFFTAGFWFAGRGKFGPAVFAAFLACLPFIGVRTVVFAVFGLGFLMWFINRQFKNPCLKLALIPLIILLWSWLHGSFLIGLVYLLFRAVFVDKSWRIAVATAVGALITIINPFGYHLWFETLAIVFDRQKTWDIGEWRIGIDFWTITPLFMLWFVGFILQPPGKLGFRKSKLRNWRYFIRFDILMFLSSLSSIRNYPLFGLAAIQPAHNALVQLDKMVRITKQGLILGKVIYGILIAGLLFITVRSFGPYVQDMVEHQQPVIATSEYNGMPHKIIGYIKDNPCQGNLFNHYDLGGYLIWQLPEAKVYVDGRMGTTWTRPSGSSLGEVGENYFNTWSLIYNGEKIELSFAEIMFGIGENDPHEYTDRAKQRQAEVFEQFNITCAVVDEDSKIYQLPTDQSWQTVVADDNGWHLLAKAV